MAYSVASMYIHADEQVGRLLDNGNFSKHKKTSRRRFPLKPVIHHVVYPYTTDHRSPPFPNVVQKLTSLNTFLCL